MSGTFGTEPEGRFGSVGAGTPPEPPPEPPFGHAIAVSSVDRYMPSFQASKLLGMRPDVFGKITGAISAITAADPPAVTVAACTLATGQRVRIDGVLGMTEVNGNYYYITVTAGNSGVDTTAFTLHSDDAMANVVGAGFTAYSGAAGTVDVDYSTPSNQVCLNKDGYFDGNGAHASTQVSTFAPDSYAGDGVTCGSTSYTQDKNARGVVISRDRKSVV